LRKSFPSQLLLRVPSLGTSLPYIVTSLLPLPDPRLLRPGRVIPAHACVALPHRAEPQPALSTSAPARAITALAARPPDPCAPERLLTCACTATRRLPPRRLELRCPSPARASAGLYAPVPPTPRLSALAHRAASHTLSRASARPEPHMHACIGPTPRPRPPTAAHARSPASRAPLATPGPPASCSTPAEPAPHPACPAHARRRSGSHAP
jgi:hypothetical protein